MRAAVLAAVAVAFTATAATARADTLENVTAVCRNVGAMGMVSIVAAEGAVQLAQGEIGRQLGEVTLRQREVDRIRPILEQRKARRAPMGDSAEDGVRILTRDAQARKAQWRTQYEPQIAPLSAAREAADASLASANAELAQVRKDLANESGILGRVFRSEVIDRLKAREAAIEASIASLQRAREDALAGEREKRAELQGLLDAEDAATNARIAEHRALWKQVDDAVTELQQRLDREQQALAKAQGEVGKLQLAVGEARECIRVARKALDNPTATTPPDDKRSSADPPYDPRNDPGTGARPPRTADASAAGRGFEQGPGQGPLAGTGQAGAPQGPYGAPSDAPMPPPNPGVLISSCVAGMTPLGYPCMPPPATGRGAAPRPNWQAITPPRGREPQRDPPPIAQSDPTRPATPPPVAPPAGPGSPPATPPTAPATPPATPPTAGGQCAPLLCREMQQINCRSMGGTACDATGVPSCGRADFTVAQVKAACYDNMLLRCQQGMAGGTGPTCARQGADPSCAVRAARVCGCDASHPQCRGAW